MGTSWFGMRVKTPPSSIFLERLSVTPAIWACRYRIISSERQRPNSRMMSVSTPPQSRALAPAARRERALTSDGRKPKDGPRKVTAFRITLVREADLIPTDLLTLTLWISTSLTQRGSGYLPQRGSLFEVVGWRLAD